LKQNTEWGGRKLGTRKTRRKNAKKNAIKNAKKMQKKRKLGFFRLVLKKK